MRPKYCKPKTSRSCLQERRSCMFGKSANVESLYWAKRLRNGNCFLFLMKKIKSPKMKWSLGAGCLLVSRLLLASWLGVVITQPGAWFTVIFFVQTNLSKS